MKNCVVVNLILFLSLLSVGMQPVVAHGAVHNITESASAAAFTPPRSSGQSLSSSSSLAECNRLLNILTKSSLDSNKLDSANPEPSDLDSGNLTSEYLTPLQQWSSEVQGNALMAYSVETCSRAHFATLLLKVEVQKSKTKAALPRAVQLLVSDALKALQLNVFIANSKEPSLRDSLLNILRDKDKYNSFVRSNRAVRLAEIVEVIKNAQDEELGSLADNILNLANFVFEVPEIDRKNPVSSAMYLYRFFKENGDEFRNNLMVRVVTRVLARYSFYYSDLGRTSLLKELEKHKGELEDARRPKNLAKEVREQLRQQIEAVKLDITNLASRRFSVREFYDKLNARILEDFDAGTQAVFQQEFEFQKNTLRESYPLGSLLIKESDFWVQASPYGIEDLLVKLTLAPNGFIHSGTIGLHYDSDFPVYYRAEIDGLKRYSAMQFNRNVVLRPNFSVAAGFSEEALKNAQSIENFYFDLLYKPGFMDNKGKVNLYCSEFVHYYYKRKFSSDLKNAPLFSSPLDYIDNKLDWGSELLVKNARQLGYIPEADYFLPDALFYTAGARVVGSVLNFSLEDNSNNAAKAALREVSAKLNDYVALKMRTAMLRPVGLFESVWIPAALGLYNATSRFPFVSNVLTHDLRRTLLELQGDGKEIAGLLKVVLSLKGEMDTLELMSQEVQKPADQAWLNLSTHFEKNSKKAVDALFF